MIRLIFRILVFFAVLAALGWGYFWVGAHVGSASIEVSGYQYSIQPIPLAGAILASLIAFYILMRLLRLIFFGRTLATDIIARRNEAKGVEAVTQSLLAVENGDAEKAVKAARKAEILLRHRADRTLTRMAQARAQTLAGNAEEARLYYEAMLNSPDTEFAGVKGLLSQAKAAGDQEKTLALTNRALALRPRDPEMIGAAFEAQVAAGQWEAARASASQAAFVRALPRDVAKRREAALYLAEAQELEAKDETAKALEAARAALAISPGLAPAAALAARRLAGGDERARAEAARILEAAWAQEPHPDVAAAFAGLAPNESPEERRKRFQRLLRQNPGHPESRMIEAEMALATGDAPAARKALEGLEESNPTARVFALRAAAARQEGADEAQVRGWMARALNAPRGAEWVCDSCGQAAPRWSCSCPHCKSFDSLRWTRRASATAAPPRVQVGVIEPLLAAPALPGQSVDSKGKSAPPAIKPASAAVLPAGPEPAGA